MGCLNLRHGERYKADSADTGRCLPVLLVCKILAAKKTQYTSAAARRSTSYEYSGFRTIEPVFGHLSGK